MRRQLAPTVGVRYRQTRLDADEDKVTVVVIHVNRHLECCFIQSKNSKDGSSSFLVQPDLQDSKEFPWPEVPSIAEFSEYYGKAIRSKLAFGHIHRAALVGWPGHFDPRLHSRSS